MLISWKEIEARQNTCRWGRTLPSWLMLVPFQNLVNILFISLIFMLQRLINSGHNVVTGSLWKHKIKTILSSRNTIQNMLTWLRNNLMKHSLHTGSLLMVITMFVGVTKGMVQSVGPCITISQMSNLKSAFNRAFKNVFEAFHTLMEENLCRAVLAPSFQWCLLHAKHALCHLTSIQLCSQSSLLF